MFGLKEAEVANLVRAITRADVERAEIRDAFARATWTGIAEPGDGIAGLAVATLGAGDSLEGVVRGWTPTEWLAALRGVGRALDVVSAGDLEQAIARWAPRLQSAAALRALRQAERCGARLVTPGSPEWPSGVDDLGHNGPIALWVRGREEAMRSLDHSMGLVGARAATGYGEHITVEAAAGLVDRGYAIVSGAAYGIDGAAHRAALASNGHTVAFLAGGVDRFYPAGHDQLLTRIVEHGAVVSELPCGSPPTKWRFLQRNRLIAAASQATVVMEAGWRSGALNTAGHAAELGRPVGAVPGPITSAASAGCHRLIREYDAILVTTPDEMAELMPDRRNRPERAGTDDVVSTAGERMSPEQTRLFDALSVSRPRTVDDVAARSGMSVALVQALLGTLELEGTVIEREHGWRRTSETEQAERRNA